MKNEKIIGFINTLHGAIQEENMELAEELLLPTLEHTNILDWNTEVIVRPRMLIDGWLMNKGVKDSDTFLFTHADFIAGHLDKIFSIVEGRQCSHDKTCTIMQKLYRLRKEGVDIPEFDYSGEYTFFLPSKVLKTNLSILEFGDAIERLYYGEVTKYLEWWKNNVIKENGKMS